MRHLTFFALMLLASIAAAQNTTPHDFPWALKLMNQSSISISRIRDPQGNSIGGTSIDLFNPSLGLQHRTKNGNLDEISLANCRLGFAIGPNSDNSYYGVGMAVKFGHFLAFGKSANRKLVPMLGLEVMPYFAVSRSPVMVNNEIYKVSQQNFGVATFLSPRLVWNPTDRIFLDFTTNISLLDLSVRRMGLERPTSTVPGHFHGMLEALKPNISMQLGVGFKF